jgi:hypothetical protein
VRRDETSVTLEGNPLPQELDKITVIDRGGGRIELVHTYMEVRIDRQEFRGADMNRIVDALRQKGWR